MSRNKTSEIPHYEMLYIISNKYSENELEPILEKIKKIIIGNEGSITHNENWGKKRLAYPIKHFHHGYYYLAEFDLPGAKLNEVDKALRMANEVLRHQIVNKKQKSASEIEQEKIISEKIAAKKQKEINEIEESKEKAKADKGKARLEDLDEKLDRILETNDLL
ncbi:30S ribosomal protein S6 [Patescibacteria group bacterium]|nr:30S ribosomal protein S6 [Candidatus Falkowbacteria bacterium]MBU3906084.1 30S ribosomal protein S6 [Patescibacteria group bacterium]MCG2698709.1 30S ribosomal protein S6 [Candidatus Parcubacteria bacterium]MBU4015138.1 30S ribosomal protein S6 [Patescibacteria group bacterium]MBU4025950.1 30S ribosomal protein S6 [Patescibacteria group bacterium]